MLTWREFLTIEYTVGIIQHSFQLFELIHFVGLAMLVYSEASPSVASGVYSVSVFRTAATSLPSSLLDCG